MKAFFKIVLYVILGIFLLSTLVALFSDNKTVTAAVPSPSRSSAGQIAPVDPITHSSKPAEPAEATSKWEYDDQTDAMTDKNTHFAMLDGDNTLELKFPYNTVKTRVQFSKKADKTTVLIQTYKGQFNTGVDGTNIRVRFDDKPAQSFSCSEANDGDASILFVDETSRFISQFRKANTVIIRAEFYDNGNQDMYFSPVGLNWK